MVTNLQHEPAVRHTAPSFRGPIVVTDIPSRLDRLHWGRFHTLVVVALGITWILDGLEVTLAGAVSGALKESPVLHFSNTDVGLAGSAYIAGAVLGSLFFGWLTDRWGRKKLFFITLAVYMTATCATALSWNVESFMLFRIIMGAGIGGEYSAINSTIQELVPARVRGWTDLIINGSFWIGAAIGAAGSIVLLNPSLFLIDTGWRVAFLIGAALSVAIFFLRMWIPESPRWLITHGRLEEAELIVARIEANFAKSGHRLACGPCPKIRLRARSHTSLAEVAATLLSTYRPRTAVGLSLMTAQAFFYNAIFFTYALILIDFYKVPSDDIGWYLLPFAAGNFPAFRYDRAPADDRLHLCSLRRVAGRNRLHVRPRFHDRWHADARLDGNPILCIRRSERRLSDRERDLPAGDSRPRDRVLLCCWHGRRWCLGTLVVWVTHRDRLTRQRV